MSITEKLEEVKDRICSEFCKYPYERDEEKEGCELCDSEVCANCPLNEL